jgi:hypothetical protein
MRNASNRHTAAANIRAIEAARAVITAVGFTLAQQRG